MNKSVQYRKAVAEDEAALAELWWGMQAEHHEYEPIWYADKGEESCKASWCEHYRGLLQNEQNLVIVAVAAGTPIGMIVAQFISRPPIFTIERMLTVATAVVRSDFRRRGVLKGMLSVLEDRARAEGITVMRLSVHQLNDGAVRAYARSGFVPETTSMIKWLD